MAVVVLIEGLVIALLGLLVAGLLRSHAEILRTLHGLEAGRVPGAAPVAAAAAAGAAAGGPPAHDIVGTSLADEVVKVGVVGARKDTLLAFLTSGCMTCIDFWDLFRSGRRLSVPGGARLVVVVKDAAEESPSRLAELAPRQHTVVLSSAAWEQYGVTLAPYFVYVDGEAGTVLAAGGAKDWDQVVGLWSKAVARARKAAGGKAGGGQARAARIDETLIEAGIHPGHASLSGPGKEG